MIRKSSLVTDEMFVKLEHFGICLYTASAEGKSDGKLVLNKEGQFVDITVQDTHVKPITRRLARFLALERAT